MGEHTCEYTQNVNCILYMGEVSAYELYLKKMFLKKRKIKPDFTDFDLDNLKNGVKPSEMLKNVDGQCGVKA